MFRLGLFEDAGWDIEKFIASTGDGSFKVVSSEEGILELTQTDIAGGVKDQ